MFTSFIVSVLVLVTGVFLAGRRPPWTLQPAMAAAATVDAARRHRLGIHAMVAVDEGDDSSILMDSLRVLGVVRQRIDRPVVGRKAYVRVWERVRALVVLAAIITALGVMLAAAIGILFLAAGFLLEQAIS